MESDIIFYSRIPRPQGAELESGISEFQRERNSAQCATQRKLQSNIPGQPGLLSRGRALSVGPPPARVMALHAGIPQSRLLCIQQFCSDAELAAFDIAKAVRAHRRVQQRRKLISDVEDHIGDLHNWPFKEQLFVLNVDAPSRGSIFRFILFALGNRVPPLPLATMLIGLGKLRTSKKRRDAWD